MCASACVPVCVCFRILQKNNKLYSCYWGRERAGRFQLMLVNGQTEADDVLQKTNLKYVSHRGVNFHLFLLSAPFSGDMQHNMVSKR